MVVKRGSLAPSGLPAEIQHGMGLRQISVGRFRRCLAVMVQRSGGACHDGISYHGPHSLEESARAGNL